jgi:hypothetical protein
MRPIVYLTVTLFKTQIKNSNISETSVRISREKISLLCEFIAENPVTASKAASGKF